MLNIGFEPNLSPANMHRIAVALTERFRNRSEQQLFLLKERFAYKTDYEESGFLFKECMIPTDKHVIELMVFSKQGVSNKQFMEFVNSLSRL